MVSKVYAYIFSSLYAALLVVLFVFVYIDIPPQEKTESNIIYVEMEEPEEMPIEEKVEEPQSAPVEQPKPEVKPSIPSNQTPAPQNSAQEVKGKEEEVRTIDPRTQFTMPQAGPDEPENAAIKDAKPDTSNKAKGESDGLNIVGDVRLDEGLEERSFGSESKIKPNYPPGNISGRLKVRVEVDMTGKVTSATFVTSGSTTHDSALVAAAESAAKRSRFRPSTTPTIGYITYVFNLK